MKRCLWLVMLLLPVASIAAQLSPPHIIELPITSLSVTAIDGSERAIPANAKAAALNVTVTGPTASGFVTVWPCGSDAPFVSSLNYVQNQTVANGVIAPIGNGKVCLKSSAPIDLVIDVSGWFEGELFTGVKPQRLIDTRQTARVSPDEPLRVAIAEANLLTLEGEETRFDSTDGSVALNVTVVNPTQSGFLTVYPCGVERPLASNVNFRSGQIVPNGVVSSMSTTGEVCIHSSAPTDIVVDIFGAVSRQGFESGVPTRIVDTRIGLGKETGVLEANQTLSIPVSGTLIKTSFGSSFNILGNASAVMLNVTAVHPEADGYATVWPCTGSVPLASNVNFKQGEIVANNVIAPLGPDGDICLYSLVPSHYVVDVSGYFYDFLFGSFESNVPHRILDTRVPLGPSPILPATADSPARIDQANASLALGAYLYLARTQQVLIEALFNPDLNPRFTPGNNGTFTENCSAGGRQVIEIVSNGAIHIIRLEDCRIDDRTLMKGEIRSELTESNERGEFTQRFFWNALEIVRDDRSEKVDGETFVQTNNISRSLSIDSRLTIASEFIGNTVRGNIKFVGATFLNDLSLLTGVEGSVSMANIGTFSLRSGQLASTDGRNPLILQGPFGGALQLESVGSGIVSLLVRYFPDVGSTATAGLQTRFFDIENDRVNFLNAVNNDTEGSFRDLGRVDPGEFFDVVASDYFFDRDGDLLSYSAILDIDPTGTGTNNFQLRKRDWRTFELQINDIGDYRLTITATDGHGFSTSGFVSIRIPDLRDSDGDGIINEDDSDDDNDGVFDSFDAFPLDPTGSKDTDGDGIADNNDTDIDNDGVPDDQDFYPEDAGCSFESDGDGQRCYSSYIRIGGLTPDFIDPRGNLYLTGFDGFLPYNIDSGRFSELFSPVYEDGRTLSRRGDYWPAANKYLVFSDFLDVEFPRNPLQQATQLIDPGRETLNRYFVGEYLVLENRIFAPGILESTFEVFSTDFQLLSQFSVPVTRDLYFFSQPDCVSTRFSNQVFLNPETLNFEVCSDPKNLFAARISPDRRLYLTHEGDVRRVSDESLVRAARADSGIRTNRAEWFADHVYNVTQNIDTSTVVTWNYATDTVEEKTVNGVMWIMQHDGGLYLILNEETERFNYIFTVRFFSTMEQLIGVLPD